MPRAIIYCMSKFRFFLIIFVGVIAGTALLEAGLRLAGVLNFPLYEQSGVLGYVPAPTQHGAFLNQNEWVFNELSMGVAEEFLPQKYAKNILLIGDSIVLGGNPVPQKDKLGPLLNRSCRSGMVWPVAAGSWAFANELRYLRLHSEIINQLDRIIFVLNSGDFGGPSVWASEVTHPTFHPRSAILQLIRKLSPRAAPSGEGKGDGDWHELASWLAQRKHPPIAIYLYPTKAETADDALLDRQLHNRIAELGRFFEVVSVKQSVANWSTSDYRDDIHPDLSGTVKLATLISEHTAECKVLATASTTR